MKILQLRSKLRQESVSIIAAFVRKNGVIENIAGNDVQVIRFPSEEDDYPDYWIDEYSCIDRVVEFGYYLDYSDIFFDWDDLSLDMLSWIAADFEDRG